VSAAGWVRRSSCQRGTEHGPRYLARSALSGETGERGSAIFGIVCASLRGQMAGQSRQQSAAASVDVLCNRLHYGLVYGPRSAPACIALSADATVVQRADMFRVH